MPLEALPRNSSARSTFPAVGASPRGLRSVLDSELLLAAGAAPENWPWWMLSPWPHYLFCGSALFRGRKGPWRVLLAFWAAGLGPGD